MPRKTTPAKPAATRKAAPARSRKKKEEPEEEVDLLSTDDEDLLSEIGEEEDGEFWQPWKDDDQPVGIQGTLQGFSTALRNAEYVNEAKGVGPVVEQMIVVDTRPAHKGTVWIVRGYQKVLNERIKEFREMGLKHGDIVAVKWRGKVDDKYHDYGKNYKRSS